MEPNSKFTSLINKKRLLKTFFEVLRIKSPSKNEGSIVSYVSGKLGGRNIEVNIDDSGKKINSNGGNIIAFLPSKLKQRVPIFLGAHLDTVSLVGDIIPVIKKGIVTNSNKKCILGGDDKVAVAAILEAINIIKDNNIKTGDIYIVFTISEEIGILGAKNLDINRIPPKYGFIFDGEGDIGKINNQAPYHNAIKIKIIGRASHAGIEPEKGINSIKVASEAITVTNTGRIDNESTSNIGVINGGVATNIVPEVTEIKAEARSLDKSKINIVTKEILNNFKNASKRNKAKINIEVQREYNGFKIEEDELPILIGKKAIQDLGIKPEVVPTGGGSDINIFNARGKKAINFSSGMENVHSNKEYVKFEELKKLVALILHICTSDLLKE